MEEWYPFRNWVTDTVIWSLSSDIDEARKAPTIALNLGGVAKDLAREIPIPNLVNGGIIHVDGQGDRQVNGVAYLIFGLMKRFAPL